MCIRDRYQRRVHGEFRFAVCNRMCLGAIVTQAACCLGKTCCESAFEFITTWLGIKPAHQVRFNHVLLFVLGLAVLTLISKILPDLVQPFSYFINCPESAGGGVNCLGISAVYRMSIALAVVFAFVLIVTLGKDRAAKLVNEGCWGFKVTCTLVLFLILFFIDNSLLDTYTNVAKPIGFLFLLFLIIMVIDLCYTWGEDWIARYDDGQEEYKWYLIVATVALYALNAYLILRGFKWFLEESSEDDCMPNASLLYANIAVIIGVSGLSISGISPNGSLLTSAGVGFLINYFVLTALASDPRHACNHFVRTDSPTFVYFEVGAGALLTLGSLIYATLADDGNSSSSVKLVQELRLKAMNAHGESNEVEMQRLPNIAPLEEAKDDETLLQRLEEREILPYKSNSFAIFHFIMLLACFFLPMLATNWGSISFHSHPTSYFQPSEGAKTLKLLAALLTGLLYTWTLVAPGLFPERKFT
eukprot:TRINITY_DN12131_c0_g1_i1.p1 TRINITY_DN12131_c0_g1~~TRINITY_DN12131_c0_g1_i1.p1  ORF type:complete len:492 (+),score=91.36 TRINITY_DN12131_c0_g1_i1:60-1478(+)